MALAISTITTEVKTIDLTEVQIMDAVKEYVLRHTGADWQNCNVSLWTVEEFHSVVGDSLGHVVRGRATKTVQKVDA